MFQKAQCVVLKGLYWQDIDTNMLIFFVKVSNFVIVVTAGVIKTEDKVGHRETGINIDMLCNTLSYH